MVTKCGQHILRVDGDATRSGGKLPAGEYGEYPTSVLDPHRSKELFFGLDKQRWAQNDVMACTSRDGESRSTREEEDASATKTKTIPEQVLGPEWEDRHMLTQRSLEGARAYCAAECERRNARELPRETSKENLQKGAVCNAFTITLSVPAYTIFKFTFLTRSRRSCGKKFISAVKVIGFPLRLPLLLYTALGAQSTKSVHLVNPMPINKIKPGR